MASATGSHDHREERATFRGAERPARVGVVLVAGMLAVTPLAVAGQEGDAAGSDGERMSVEVSRLVTPGTNLWAPISGIGPGVPVAGVTGVWTSPEFLPSRAVAVGEETRFRSPVFRGLAPRPELPPPGAIYGTPISFGRGHLRVGQDGTVGSDGGKDLNGIPLRFLSGQLPLRNKPEER